MPKLKTTAVFTGTELSELILDNMENGVAKVSVPRKEGEKPTATIAVSSEALAEAIAAGLSTEDNEVSAADLTDMEMSVKKNGDVELTF